MRSLKVLRERHTFPEAIESGVNFKEPMLHSNQRLFTAYADAAERFGRISHGLQRLCRTYLDFNFESPTVSAFGAEVAAQPYSDTLATVRYGLDGAITALVAVLKVPQIGHVEWYDDENCRFTYYEVERDPGLLRRTVRRVAHVHDVVKARSHHLPATDVPMPRRAQQIVRSIPDALRPYTRVLTGLEVRNEVREDSRREEATWLGQAFAHGKQQLRSATGAAGAGLTAVGGALRTSLAGALSAIAAPLAIADPAIVIGDVCLYGWEN